MRVLFSLPNAFSCARIVLAVFFVKALFEEPSMLGMALLYFSLAVLTDLLDGYFARRYNLITRWGAFLDPIADKFLVFAAFISFFYKGLVPLWMVFALLLRDGVVTTLRFKLLYNRVGFKTSFLAKSKTVVQFLAIYCMFVYTFVESVEIFTVWMPIAERIVSMLLYASVGLTLYSGVEYIYRYALCTPTLLIFSQPHEH